jgi:hypothetical protein
MRRWLSMATESLTRMLESGRFGLIHRFTQQNDECRICPGLQVPLTLRLTENPKFGLVGDSYIHGVKAGEVMAGLNNEEARLGDIVLS